MPGSNCDNCYAHMFGMCRRSKLGNEKSDIAAILLNKYYFSIEQA